MRTRIGDRRARPRFDILGTLTGTLETWQRFMLRNVSVGGALAEAHVPIETGSLINGRLSLRGQSGDIRGEVRHLSTARRSDAALRYLAGIAWVETSPQVDDLLNAEAMKPWRGGLKQRDDRRATPRFAATSDAELGRPVWVTVELVDISTNGVLIEAPQPLVVGETGQLRVRLGEQSFAAQIEVRRGEQHQRPQTGYRFGAAFTAIDEGSRLGLEDFIGGAGQ